MATISNTPRPGYVWDATDNVWYPIGVGAHQHTNAADTPAVMPYSTYAAAGKNKIINGDFGVWQRGTSFTGSSLIKQYFADRFYVYMQGLSGTPAFSVTQQTFTPGAAPVSGYEGKFFARIACTNMGSSTLSSADLWQPIEDVRTLAGQTVTLSFWAKASSNITVKTRYSQVFGSGGSAENFNEISTVSVTTSWQRFSVTFTPTSLSGKTVGDASNALYVGLAFPYNSTFEIDLWGMQVEAGSTATAFQTATGNPASELAACQRYYIRNTYGTAYGSYCLGYATSTTNVYALIPLPVPMRVMPTSIEYGNLCLDLSGQAIYTITSLAGSQSTTYAYGVNVGSTGLTQHRVYDLANNNNTAGYLAFSAEF